MRCHQATACYAAAMPRRAWNEKRGPASAAAALCKPIQSRAEDGSSTTPAECREAHVADSARIEPASRDGPAPSTTVPPRIAESAGDAIPMTRRGEPRKPPVPEPGTLRRPLSEENETACTSSVRSYPATCVTELGRRSACQKLTIVAHLLVEIRVDLLLEPVDRNWQKVLLAVLKADSNLQAALEPAAPLGSDVHDLGPWNDPWPPGSPRKYAACIDRGRGEGEGEREHAPHRERAPCGTEHRLQHRRGVADVGADPQKPRAERHTPQRISPADSAAPWRESEGRLVHPRMHRP